MSGMSVMARSPADDPEPLRVLVVDDDPGTLDCLREGFEHHGCLVSAAAPAGHALARLAAEGVHLVVSDIRMPGLSGLDLLDAVKRRRPGTPVVLLTGSPSIDSALFSLRQGAYDYLTKPVSMRRSRSRTRAPRFSAMLGPSSIPSWPRRSAQSPWPDSPRSAGSTGPPGAEGRAVAAPLRSARARRGPSPSRHGR